MSNMYMNVQDPYRLDIDADQLYFSTASFKAEKESVLHKGIYNYELSSMIAALIISGMVYVIAAYNSESTLIHYVMSSLTLMISFILCRLYIFRKRHLEAVFDNKEKVVRIRRPAVIGMKKEVIPFCKVQSVEVGSSQISPVNIDGIEFVQKISAQHGSPMPDLGEEKEFVTLVIKLDDGSDRIIYAEKIENNNEPSLPLKEIREFIKV